MERTKTMVTTEDVYTKLNELLQYDSELLERWLTTYNYHLLGIPEEIMASDGPDGVLSVYTYLDTFSLLHR